jgi:hypothetical protein
MDAHAGSGQPPQAKTILVPAAVIERMGWAADAGASYLHAGESGIRVAHQCMREGGDGANLACYILQRWLGGGAD